MKLNKLTDKVYYTNYVSEGDRPVLGLVIGEKSSLIIDAGNSKAHTEAFINEAKKLAKTPIKYIAITHWHWDHVFGIHWAKNIIDATVISHKFTNEKLEYLSHLKWDDSSLEERVKSGEEIEFCKEHMKIELPKLDNIVVDKSDIVFEKEVIINIGNINCRVLHIGGDHSKDSTVIIVEEEKVAFLGDCLYLDMYHGNWSYSREKLYPMLEELEKLNANFYIPSHHNMYNRSEFLNYKAYLKEIGDIVEESKSIEDSIKKFENFKQKEASDDEKYDIECFIEGNIKRN